MAGSTQGRRFVSPAGLLLVLLGFFLPFLTVSCSSGFGEMSVTVSGMDQVVNGVPAYSGYRPPASQEQSVEVGVSPLMVIAVVAIVAGIGLGLGLPKALARWAAGAGASLLALFMVVINQITLRSKIEQELAKSAAELDNGPFAAAIQPMIKITDEVGFWIALVLLLITAAYNILGVVWQRSPERRSRFVGGGASSAPPSPYPGGGYPYPPGGRPAPPSPGQAPPPAGQWYPEG